MFTSSFWRFHLKEFPQLVSIAWKSPEWFRGRRYPALAPRKDMLAMAEAMYRREYQKILDRLDPRRVYEELGSESVLLCWEGAGQFCHRRLVAQWLEEHLEVIILELPQHYNLDQLNLFT